MPTISVIIPVYKAGSTIQRCVDSIEANTFTDFEVILVEDHSPDNSWEVCLSLQKKYYNITAVRNEKNCGVSYTRNRGIDLANGQFAMFVDSDDWVEPDFLAQFYEMVRCSERTIAVCGYVNHDEKHSGRTDEFKWLDSDDSISLDFSENVIQLYKLRLLQQLWNKAFLTSIIKENGIRFDESISIGEDFRFILVYLRCLQPTHFIMNNRCLYHYMRDQDDSLMQRIGYEGAEEAIKNMRVLYELLCYSKEKIEEQLTLDRRNNMESYAYLIMHNAGMKWKEKKKLIYRLDAECGKALYVKNRNLWIKEKIAKAIR